MKQEFIPYEQALELKELGFDEKCFQIYNHNGFYDGWSNIPKHLMKTFIDAPLYQQAFRWFREKYQLYAWIKVEYEYGGITPTYYITGKRQDDIPGGPFNTYEEAELACLKKLIEIIKNK
jgi:hypothetical protein